jgi:hypothetical protein
VQEQNHLMLDAGVDMIGVIPSSPYTAERDAAGIASSPLAAPERPPRTTGGQQTQPDPAPPPSAVA